MQQHLGRLDGVLRVEVSLADGKAVIYPKGDGRLDPTLVVKATFDSGVTLAEIRITASGNLRKDPDKGLVFEISPAQVFPVVPNEQLQPLESSSGQVTVTGILYRKPAGKPKKNEVPVLRLEILSVEKK